MNNNRQNVRAYPPMRQPARRPAARPAKRTSWLRRQMARRPRPLWMVIVADLLAVGIALLVFALFHHVLPSREQAVGVASQRAAAAPTVSATAVPVDPAAVMQQAQSVPQPAQEEPEGYFGVRFADKFTSGDVVRDAASYRSGNLNITMSTMRENNAQVYLVDFYVKDIACLKSAFANGTFGKGQREHLVDVAMREGSVVAINGDYYGGHSEGVVIRNGMLYRDDESLEMDIGVIYWDGTMKTFSPSEFDADAEIANGAYQAWSFGPELLDANGQAMTSFNTKVNPKNPRTAIGYYEPGHYCFVVVDGRSETSEGLDMADLSSLMYKLGCKVAYNLDGGASSELVWGNQRINQPYKDGRPCTDAVLLVDAV